MKAAIRWSISVRATGCIESYSKNYQNLNVNNKFLSTDSDYHGLILKREIYILLCEHPPRMEILTYTTATATTMTTTINTIFLVHFNTVF